MCDIYRIIFATSISCNPFIFLTGQYNQNLCKINSPSCIPCPERLPSCLGIPDGLQVHPQRLWTAWYIVCDRNRTIEINKCQHGQIFDPQRRQCVTADKTGTFVVWFFFLSCRLVIFIHFAVFKCVCQFLSFKTLYFLFIFNILINKLSFKQ